MTQAVTTKSSSAAGMLISVGDKRESCCSINEDQHTRSSIQQLQILLSNDCGKDLTMASDRDLINRKSLD